MVSLSSAKFPEVYTGSEAPAAFGVREDESKSVTPVYRYGWVVSRTELYEALNGEPCRYDRHLYRIHVGAGQRLYDLWKEKGYDNNKYNPNIPCVKEFGPKHVVIYMACNDSDAIIESIMKNEIFHKECRACMSNPNAMVMEPAWIRVGMRHCPKELSGTVVSDTDQRVRSFHALPEF